MKQPRFAGILHASFTDEELGMAEFDGMPQKNPFFAVGDIEEDQRFYVKGDDGIFYNVNKEAVSEEVRNALEKNRNGGAVVTFSIGTWQKKKYARNIRVS